MDKGLFVVTVSRLVCKIGKQNQSIIRGIEI